MKEGIDFRLAWGITGAGDLLSETFEAMESVSSLSDVKITAVLSKAASFVIKTYGFWERLEKIAHTVLVEKDANTPFIAGSLQMGKYDLLLVAPATGNSVAKIAHGICDSLVTNAVAMTNKTKTEVVILPVEQKEGKIETTLPNGKSLEIFSRKVDVENTVKLAAMEGIRVLTKTGDIQPFIVGKRNSR